MSVLAGAPATAASDLLDAPRNLLAAPGDERVTLAWDAPAWDGREPILGYVVYVDDVFLTQVGTATSHTVTGLVNGRSYGFAVSAWTRTIRGLHTENVYATPVAATGEPPAVPVTGCDGSAPDLSSLDPGLLVLADNFERGTFEQWATVVNDGDATTRVVPDRQYTGACAAELRVSRAPTSRAFLRAPIGWEARDVWASGVFRIEGEGGPESNVPVFRLWNGDVRIIDVYRHNVDGQLWLRTAAGAGDGEYWYVDLGRALRLDHWYEVRLHVRPAGPGSTVEVWLDGTRVYASARHRLPDGGITSVMIGAEHVRQEMLLYVDDVSVTAT